MTTAYVFIIGLCLGSFVNALIWRLHEQDKPKATKKRKAELSVMKGRSMCPGCGHSLSALDLIPVISWLNLRGKCRYCNQSISWQYPLVELLTGITAAISYVYWPYGRDLVGFGLFAAWMLSLTGLVALTIYDAKWMLLPNRIVYPLTVYWAVVTAVKVVITNDLSIISGAILGVIFCGGIFWILFQLSRGSWIGGGDVKLGFLLGLLVGGPVESLVLIFLSSLLGTLYILPLMSIGKISRSSRIPFGPFLIVSAIIVFLLGPNLRGALDGLLLIS